MALVSLDIPPGVVRKGTELESTGRWYDSNFVRWVEGVMQPVGGWQERDAAISLTGAARSLLTWRTNSGLRYIGVGTSSKLYAISSGNTVYDITPIGFTVGSDDATTAGGYGTFDYGDGYFGTPRPDTVNPTAATTWMLDTWGQYLVGCSTTDGKLYEWQLNTSTPAAAIANAPTSCSGILVSNERAIFALGAGGDPRQVAWSDIENNTVWTPSSTNNAGSVILQTAGRLVTARRVRGQTLFLTDIDAHVATYVGQPFVYTFEVAGRACGAISQNCVASVEQFAVWMGEKSFFVYDGYVRPLPCEVSDYVFSDINVLQISKVYATTNASNNEVWWFYPSSGSNENDRYVMWNYTDNYWATGELSRTCSADAGVFRNPLMIDASGNLYDHEVGTNRDGASVYVESGPVQLGDGDRVVYANELIPDELNQGDVTLSFYTRYYPNDEEKVHGPYSLTNPTSVRFNGRQVKMRITENTPTQWRVGSQRVNVVPGGRR
jgi:hypothetical protein